MADSLPSPPTSVSSIPEDNFEHNGLAQKLDELLEQYLELLDQYTTLREELSKIFSAGFFSLAQAQRTSNLGAGRRYGQDCYDERMKAHRRAHIVEKEFEGVRYSVKKSTSPMHADQQKEKTSDQSADATDDNSTAVAAAREPSQQLDSKTYRQQQSPASRDPLKWFGILAPPALRQTQSHFVAAIDGPIPSLLSVNSEMQLLEEEIWSLRDQLGRLAEKEDAGANQDEVVGINDPNTSSKQQQTLKSSRRTNVASRQGHSRSQLLKLGD